MNIKTRKLKLSIITTCKNEAANIAKTIESVVKQTFDRYEYIVVDGGSVDGTLEIIESYRDSITKYVSENDRGIWHAMNKGISLADGEYVYFLNAGDKLCELDTLRRVFNDDERTEDIVFGNIIEDYGDRKVQKNYSDTISIKYLLSNMICHQATFVRKVLFDKYGYFDERYKFVADYEFLWRCIVGHKVSYKHVPETIAYYDMNGFTANPDNRDMLVYEWLAVRHNNLSSFQYAYFLYVRPFLVKIRNYLLKAGTD